MILRLFLCVSMLASGHAAAQEATVQFGTGAQRLNVRSTTDIAIIAPVLDGFIAENPQIRIDYEQWGSNALQENTRRACAGEIDAADAVFSSAVHHMVGLVNSACARSYRSALTDALAPTRRWRDELWGITEEPAVLIYNTEHVAPEDVPRSRFDLLDLMRRKPDSYRNRIATYDIEASGLGYLYAFSDSLEATTFGSLLEGFARTEAVATCCSAEIIDAVSEARFLLGYNVLGSYVQNAAAPNVGVILPEDYTVFLSRAYMITTGAKNPDAAQKLLDFLLSREGQNLLARSGMIYPDDPSETGLLPSAKRFVALAPPLLVALDRGTRERFLAFWSRSFFSTQIP
ncbi:ABC transporter substrate-binding protein [Tropicimonas marinistellae]|uniref:ABC transporter substrate-binding protein n=1 Tax=Tropicimonas marinistellae TaxID=1739787 RepID=UPI00082D284C|nr:ABC transporter substrate-binding protein [Tropicimonas marinistellae]